MIIWQQIRLRPPPDLPLKSGSSRIWKSNSGTTLDYCTSHYSVCNVYGEKLVGNLCANFGENRSTDVTVRVDTDTHMRRHKLLICPMLYAIAMGQIIKIIVGLHRSPAPARIWRFFPKLAPGKIPPEPDAIAGC